MNKLVALYKHWCIADFIKVRVAFDISRELRAGADAGLSKFLLESAELHSAFLTLQVWYALLYVVVEEYKELKLRNCEIDKLLSEADRVDLLRLFRNATFHYQEDP